MFLNRPVKTLCISPNATISEAISAIEKGTKQIALVINKQKVLIGIITDGDIRRSILKGLTLTTSVKEIMQKHFIKAQENVSPKQLLEIMRNTSHRHIPIVDKAGRIKDLAWITDLLKKKDSQYTALIMAGGYGQRLKPLTDKLPKPLLPVGDKPIIGHIVKSLRKAGVRQINVSTHYKANLISEHFEKQENCDVEIKLLNESTPLGTAGALQLLERPQKPILVINGDILTHTDFDAMWLFHKENKADMTVGICQYNLQIPYGVVETDGTKLTSLTEKPNLNLFINAGIYLIEPIVYDYLPQKKYLDMPDLIKILLQKKKNITSFPLTEYWIDVGRLSDYKKARGDIAKKRGIANGLDQ